MSCEVRKLPNFSKKPDVFSSFHLWFHSRWLFLSNAVPCFSLGGKYCHVSSKEVVSFPAVVLFSRPSSAWHSHRGMHPRPTHRPSFSAWKKDPVSPRWRCDMYGPSEDIRSLQKCKRDCRLYICYIYIYDVFIDICMTPWHILFSRQFFLQFLRSCDFGMSLPAETGLALCEPLWAINQAPPRHFFIAQRWNR